jgi:hypothetical protein
MKFKKSFAGMFLGTLLCGSTILIFQNCSNQGFDSISSFQSPSLDIWDARSLANISLPDSNLVHSNSSILSKKNSACVGKPIAPILVIAGQSNAVGLGKISDLAPDHWLWPFWKKHGYNFKYWSMRKNASWSDGKVISTGDVISGAHVFGPEMTIAASAESGGLRDFFIYKMAVGGSYLANVSGTAKSTTEWRQRGGGGIYDSAVKDLKKAADQICNSGLQPVVIGFFWMQGESDSINLAVAGDYSRNLTTLITEAREDFMDAHTPVILGKIRTGPQSICPWTFSSIIRYSDDYVASTLLAVSTIETNDLGYYPPPCSGVFCIAHYNTEGQMALGKRFYAALAKEIKLQPKPVTPAPKPAPAPAPKPPVAPPVVTPKPPVTPPVVTPKPPVAPPVVTPKPPVAPPVVTPKPPVAPPPAPTQGEVKGVIDGISAAAQGSYNISGWACAQFNPQSLSVHLYLGGAAGSGTLIGATTANGSSEAQVATACSSTGNAYRFSIPLSKDQVVQFGGKKIYVHGISPFGLGNHLLSNSGHFIVPMPPITAIHEFFKGTDYFETASVNEGTKAGFASKGVAFKVYASQASDLVAVYRCYVSSSKDHFVSRHANCEKQTTEGNYGFIYPNPTPGHIPVYRYRNPTTGDHMANTGAAPAGYTQESILGYAPK